ncbi:serine hydrolase domain-containing protein [Acanthopleuribacter pedis]|uniref:Beta-lactamase family protein n=1 Tax=Acanthopleuribacter pedis TaxID=442870 RepID=A0A8J7QMB4_9BACT|nr:serine hydrolase domain-containing protein [Acanthopleuribacter pedis]MBO1320620.1 beta-lactamase family protein [Acanthopleuribacter pedis]
MVETLQKVGVYIFGFLFIFGLVGSTVLFVWEGRNNLYYRPDQDLDARIERLGPKGDLAIAVARFPQNKFAKIIYQREWSTQNQEGPLMFPMKQLAGVFRTQAALILVDREQLSLEAPITDTLTDVPPTFEGITLEHLLSQTSGLTGTLDAGNPPEHPPGTVNQYAPINDALVLRLIEAASGETAQAFIQREIIETLEMKCTEYREAEQGWFSCVEDVMNWELDLYRHNLIKLKTYLRAFKKVGLANGEPSRFSLGWYPFEYGGFRVEEAPIDASTNHSILRFSERAFSLVVLSSIPREELDARQIAREVGLIYMEREMPYPDRIKDKFPLLGPKIVPTAPEDANTAE